MPVVPPHINTAACVRCRHCCIPPASGDIVSFFSRNSSSTSAVSAYGKQHLACETDSLSLGSGTYGQVVKSMSFWLAFHCHQRKHILAWMFLGSLLIIRSGSLLFCSCCSVELNEIVMLQTVDLIIRAHKLQNTSCSVFHLYPVYTPLAS